MVLKVQEAYHNQQLDFQVDCLQRMVRSLLSDGRIKYMSSLSFIHHRFSDRIQPWLHYVPIQVDYSDLLDTLYFFRGDPSGHGAHPELAKKIAESGRQWSLDHWRKPDLTAYMFR